MCLLETAIASVPLKKIQRIVIGSGFCHDLCHTYDSFDLDSCSTQAIEMKAGEKSVCRKS